MLEDPHQAIEWLMQLTSVTPTDAQVLAKLGDLYDNEGDKSQAFQYYYEVNHWDPYFIKNTFQMYLPLKSLVPNPFLKMFVYLLCLLC